MRQQILLGCGCRPWFSGPIPKVGETLYCVGHRKGADRVTAVDWNYKCENCRHGRYNLGSAGITADTAASRHAIRKGHRVRVWCQTDHIVTATHWCDGASHQLPLPEKAPF